MTAGRLLKLMRRVYSNLDIICKVGRSHRDPHEDQALDYNCNLQGLIEAGLNMSEWLIRESAIKPSYGQGKLPDGRLVQLKRVTAEVFFRRANPAMQYLADEISERSGVEAGDKAVAPTSLMLPQWALNVESRI
jgi:hypothetical protein